MANESIRIRTKPGATGNVRIKLEQDFNFLEILSLKISQEDLYQTFCANYGVVVGRVIANRGFGVPNAKVSVFVPITSEDQKNELIKDFYPFKTAYQKNPSTGVRYNLLLSKSTCILNKAVGTFPTKEEVLNNDIILEVFDKYYKYTTKTNDSGDFMIFGVPTGQQTIHMDVDFSDAGILSIRPYDLIDTGYPEKLFESRVEFKTSTNLDILPQLKSGNISVDVVPFWGDPENCEIGITRVDFDTNVEIKTNAIFFGSIFTDSGKMNLNKGCNPRNAMGEEDNLKTGKGNIGMIRVKEINPNDWENGVITPIELEEFSIEGGDLINDDGVFAFSVPMNIGHIITDEFGSIVPSPDPSIGVATKGMYRFKMKFTEPNDNPKFRTATLFFPSLGQDFGGTRGVVDTGSLADANGTQDQRYTTDISQYDTSVYPNARIFLDFHTFEWKQLYTIAHYFKKYKKGGNRFSFVGLKNTDVSAETNLFPFNNVIWKFDIIYYVIAFFIDVVTFLIRLLIILISFCIQICADVTVPEICILKACVGPWNIIRFCYQICPFSWLGNFVKFDLPCEGAVPDDSYQIPLGGDWYQCNPSGCGTSFGCNCPSNPCGQNDFKLTTSNATDDPNNPCLNSLTDWQCCVKYNAAELRNVMRRVFNDGWVFGTAYLFQFKYKKKKNGKEKFCGPGADHARGDNYVSNQCCLDSSGNNTCDKCLLRGQNTTAFKSQFRDYHRVWHNYATDASINGVGSFTGAVDVDDIIYCNILMSTKIVSLGRIEMCEETLEGIQSATLAGQALRLYSQNSSFYTGTFYENGWDAGYWVQFLKESSYEDPREVFLFLGKNTSPKCQYRKLFHDGGLSGYPCHEYELKDDPFFFLKEVSRIYTDIELGGTYPDEDEFFGGVPLATALADPYGSMTNDQTVPPAYGGFLVDAAVASRFSPCGGNPSNCYGQPSNNWTHNINPINSFNVSLTNPNQADNDGWDRYLSQGNRNNPNSRSNIPYYYFGINPGKTAINKLKKDFFVQK